MWTTFAPCVNKLYIIVEKEDSTKSLIEILQTQMKSEVGSTRFKILFLRIKFSTQLTMNYFCKHFLPGLPVAWCNSIILLEAH